MIDAEKQRNSSPSLQVIIHVHENLLGTYKRLCKALIPNFPVGCRRLTPAPGYLASLTKGNVRVVTDKIIRVITTGIEISTGKAIGVDVLICATGFDLSFRPRFPLICRKSNLQDL
jgi:cation diffusion facilitator CzcD-associated flavoprotein CzcO